MSKVELETNSNKKKKKIRSQINDESNILKTHNFLNFLNEDEDEDELDIFCQNNTKRSSRPTVISNVLLSNNNKILVKSGNPKILRNVQNDDDVFTKNIVNSPFYKEKKFNGMSSNKNDAKNHEYSLSEMFSDGLSDTEDSELKVIHVSSSDVSRTDILPRAIKTTTRKAGKKECDRDYKVVKKLAQDRSESSDPKAIDSLRMNFIGEKLLDEIFYDHGKENSQKPKEDSKIVSLKTRKKPSSTFVPSRRSDSGINSPPCNSVDAWIQGGVQKDNENEEPSVVDEKLGDRSISNICNAANSTPKIICNTESHSIDIALSECNLDNAAINSEDLENEDKKAMWVFIDNNLTNENGNNFVAAEEFVSCEINRIDRNVDANNELVEVTPNVDGNDSAIELQETNVNSQNSFRSTDTFAEFFDMGSQISCRSDISLVPFLPEFHLSQVYESSFEEENIIHEESGPPTPTVLQSVYTKQRNSCVIRENSQETKKIEQFKPKDDLPVGESSRKEFTDSNSNGSTLSSLTNNSLKRRYPFDQNSRVSDPNVNDGMNIFKRSKPSEGTRDIFSGNQYSSSFTEDFIISHENAMKRSSRLCISKVAHRVQSFVAEFLNREDDENEEGIYIDQEMLLSNYSSGYDREAIERFKPKSDWKK